MFLCSVSGQGWKVHTHTTTVHSREHPARRRMHGSSTQHTLPAGAADIMSWVVAVVVAMVLTSRRQCGESCK